MITEPVKSPFAAEPSTEDMLGNVNRPLPFSNEAEKGVLSCCLQDPARRVRECRDEIHPAAFYHVANRIVYETLLEFDDRGTPLDIGTLMHALREKGTLEKVGGGAAISELYTFLPISAHYPFYKKLMLDKFTLRKVINASVKNILAAYEHGREHIDEDVEATLAAAEERILEVRESGKMPDVRTRTMTECVMEHLDYMEALKTGAALVYPIGLPSFDKRARGIAHDEYVLLTGPTKGGKSTLWQKIFQRTALSGVISVDYTLEVSPRTRGGRAIYSTGHVNASLDRTGMLNHEHEEAYGRACREIMTTIGKTAIVVNASGMTLEQILSDMKEKYEAGARLFGVDYIGKAYSSQRFNNRERELSYMSNRLFDFTKRPGKPATVVCLAQLNDAGEVRDCRGLEHDCDMHLKIKRVFLKPAKRDDPPTEVASRRTLVVERGRSIESGYPIPIFFDGSHYKFEESDENREQTEHWQE